jgi:hypothetical protein
MSSQRPSGPPCRECGGPTWARNQRQLCPTCKRLYCITCGVKKPAGRTHRQCLDCRRAEYRQQLKNHPDDCMGCGGPKQGLTTHYCRDCHREIYQLQKRARARLGPRPCVRCPTLLPPERQCIYCTACNREIRLQRASQHRPCARCGRYARAKSCSYCRFCRNIDRNQRRAGLKPTKKEESQ